MKHKALVLGAVLALAGCGDSKTPETSETSETSMEANLRTALQQWYDAHPDCVRLSRGGGLPIERDASDPADRTAIAAAVAAGLLAAEPLTGGRVRYDPTEAARDAVRNNDNRFAGGVDLCYARRNIEAVENFTEPTDAMGVQATRATYRYTLKDTAPWANYPAIAAAFPAIPQALAKPPTTDADDLVLTDNGWTHHLALR